MFELITFDPMYQGPIGVFDSGYGGLTILKEFVKVLPAYDYLYLGDNARAPYGTRSFESVYQYTLECVQLLYDMGARLIILACNTASAKALRSIQQKDMHLFEPGTRVLGIIRPTSEIIGNFSKTKKIGILGTPGTIHSQSYRIEIEKFFPDIEIHQEACPMWVPLVENDEHENEGADYFVKKNIQRLLRLSVDIDAILLACTHYPLLTNKIMEFLPPNIQLISQGPIVANSLKLYLRNHPEIEARCSKNMKRIFYTTDSAQAFDIHASGFFGEAIKSESIGVSR